MKQRELSRRILHNSVHSLEYHRVSSEIERTAKDILPGQSGMNGKATHVNRWSPQLVPPWTKNHGTSDCCTEDHCWMLT